MGNAQAFPKKVSGGSVVESGITILYQEAEHTLQLNSVLGFKVFFIFVSLFAIASVIWSVKEGHRRYFFIGFAIGVILSFTVGVASAAVWCLDVPTGKYIYQVSASDTVGIMNSQRSIKLSVKKVKYIPLRRSNMKTILTSDINKAASRKLPDL
jgi:hypothetical protein